MISIFFIKKNLKIFLINIFLKINIRLIWSNVKIIQNNLKFNQYNKNKINKKIS